MMEEVITRRFKNNTTIQPPDLVLIDGGKGHLRKVQDTLNQIKNHKIFVLAVSKGRDRNSGNENFYYGDNKELFLNKNDPIRFFYKIYVMRRIDLQLDIIEVKGQKLFLKIL